MAYDYFFTCVTIHDHVLQAFGHCELIISRIVSLWRPPWSLTVWSAYHNKCLATINASNSSLSIEKQQQQLKCEKHTLACFILSHHNLAEIGHIDEPKSLLPDFGQNQRKTNAYGAKFYEIKET